MLQLRLLVAVAVAVSLPSIASAELPTADQILQIHRANRTKLARLHLQLVQTEEATAAEAADSRKSDDNHVLFAQVAAKMLESKLEDMQIEFDGKTLKGEEAKAILTQIVAEQKRNSRQRSERKAFQMFTPMEFFLDGDDYQFREARSHLKTVDELAGWKFLDVPLTAESLATDFHKTMIFSRSHLTNPRSRWWSMGSVCNAYIMQKHLCDVMHLHLPPYTEVTGSRWDCRHGYDHFFSQAAEKYRVIRQDKIDNTELTVVDVEVPIGADSKGLLCYRAWLDLKRGATPIKLFHSQGIAGNVVVDRFESQDPNEITVTHEVRELPNGAFYPSKVVLEQWGNDPDAPQLTKDEIAEVRAGKRKPQRAVHRRRTWECTLVDVETKFDEDFFILPFSPDEKVFDHDAEKMIGALESQPVPKIGQQAPPLKIARWLDGRPRTLDDLKGQVVVLDFWGLWCRGCREEVTNLKVLQEKFHDRPVVFIAIHSAESKTDALAARITEFQKEKGWKFIGAIDSGRMVEDSATTMAYGVDHFPFMVVIGPDGKVVYADPAADGPECDEDNPIVMAAFEKTFNDYWQLRFKAVGEAWPMNEGLDQKAQVEIYQRVQLKYVIQQIESAIPKK